MRVDNEYRNKLKWQVTLIRGKSPVASRGRIITSAEIDGINTKIIKDLLADARKSFVDIASECHVSTATIGERFSQLEESGIIVGSTLQINHKATRGGATCSVIVKADQKEIEQVLDYIKKIPFKIPYLAKSPKNNITLIAGLKDINEVGKLKEFIRRNTSVLELKTEIWTDVKNMPEKLAVSSLSVDADNPVLPNKFDCQVNLDTLDFHIIEKLMQNSMQPFVKIANEIGTSVNTVSRKYKKLSENGVIRPTLQVNLPKLGYHAVAIFGLAFASQTDTDSVTEEVMKIRDNTLIIKTSGEFDLLAHIMLKDINQLLATQNQAAKIPGISKIEITVVPVVVPWPSPGEYISTF